MQGRTFPCVSEHLFHALGATSVLMEMTMKKRHHRGSSHTASRTGIRADSRWRPDVASCRTAQRPGKRSRRGHGQRQGHRTRSGSLDPKRDPASLRLGLAGLTVLAAGLFAAHDIVVGRRLGEEAALEHPVDLFLELGWLIGLHAGELGKEATLALGRREVAQELGARALLVLGEPFDGAVEGAA